MKNNNWTKDELIVAFNLYCKTPFKKINANNKGIKSLASIIGRSASAVALKLANYARLDPTLQARSISGMSHGSKGEIEVWADFHQNWDDLVYESEKILATYTGNNLESLIGNEKLPENNTERLAFVKQRINQNFFRETVLASYDNKCCITGIAVPELLIAGHIIPWAADTTKRMKPANGICMNALHDKAFDRGLITITTDFKIKISGALRKELKKNESASQYFFQYDNYSITLPQKFLPEREFLEYHNDTIFKK